VTKIIAGIYVNPKTKKREVVSAILPIRLYIGCQWCGTIVSDKMYLIRQEDEYDELERHYSALCKCGLEEFRNHPRKVRD